MPKTPHLAGLRRSYHKALLESVLKIEKGIPTNADGNNQKSVDIAYGVLRILGNETAGVRLAPQISGRKFEHTTTAFLRDSFLSLSHLRPGSWEIQTCGGRSGLAIARFAQYRHLLALDAAVQENIELAVSIGNDYTVTPDIVLFQQPFDDDVINERKPLVDKRTGGRAVIRAEFQPYPLLHASISCKWTIRSDRVQNVRTEALNLIRNRKGRLPHIVLVTGEPLPSRLSAIALGTGDLDCVYHIALPELLASVGELGDQKVQRELEVLVNGYRLKDIADLPLDLVM